MQSKFHFEMCMILAVFLTLLMQQRERPLSSPGAVILWVSIKNNEARILCKPLSLGRENTNPVVYLPYKHGDHFGREIPF